MRRCIRAAGLAFAVCVLVPATAGATTATVTSVIVSPDGKLVYAGFNGVGFSVFSRDPSTGQLSVLGEAPGAQTGGGLFNPSLAVSPDGGNVYGVDGQGNQLLQYAPASGGVAAQQSYPVLADTTVAKDPITPTGLARWLQRLRAQLRRAVRKQRSHLGRQDQRLSARPKHRKPHVAADHAAGHRPELRLCG